MIHGSVIGVEDIGQPCRRIRSGSQPHQAFSPAPGSVMLRRRRCSQRFWAAAPRTRNWVIAAFNATANTDA
jgi:hypothetical protein